MIHCYVFWKLWCSVIPKIVWPLRIWVSSSEVDEPRACYTEWSKLEREKQILYINTYVWNLEKGADEPICRAGVETQA